MEISLKANINQLIVDYYAIFPDMQRVPVNIIISDCLSRSQFALRPDLKEHSVNEIIEKREDINGRMVLPYKVKEPINILMNKQKMIEYTENGTYTWIGTCAHELTHAIDYHQMAVKENLDFYDPLREISEYLMFQMWSEYHARKIGYMFLRNKLKVDVDDNTKEDRIKHILKIEWPHHKNQHYNDYHNAHDIVKEIYCTMQLLGRFSVWCDLFPDVFNESFINSTYQLLNAPWMYLIFQFLQQYDTLNDIYLYFDNMRLILKENWEGL